MLKTKIKASDHVEEGFETFAKRLAPVYSEPELAETQLHLIERCLRAQYEMSYLAPYGSTGHGTNVADQSAIDSFAVIPKARLYEDSAKSLEEVHGVLEGDLPGAFLTEGRPVIVVPFGESRSERHHIVPAFPMGTRDEHDVYCIPGPSERWIEACPGGHSAWINVLDIQFGQRLKPFVRMVKSWNYGAGSPFWSFYLEVCAAEFMRAETSGRYAVDLDNFFTYMLKRRVAPFKTSEGSNEPVYGTSLADKFAAMDHVRSASEKAKMACFSERQGNAADAFFWWRKLFNYQFPAF